MSEESEITQIIPTKAIATQNTNINGLHSLIFNMPNFISQDKFTTDCKHKRAVAIMHIIKFIAELLNCRFEKQKPNDMKAEDNNTKLANRMICEDSCLSLT